MGSERKDREVRKTRPKLETPFKCYIYCSQSGVALGAWGKHGKVIGEFTCDRIYKIDKDSTDFLFKAGGLSVYKQAAEEKCVLCVAMHTGKGRMDLLPWSAIMEVSKHCEAGALKYGEHNVDKGIPTHSLLDSAIRHAAKYLAGYVDEPHLVAAAWNLLWAIEMEIVHTECVDTPWRASDGE